MAELRQTRLRLNCADVETSATQSDASERAMHRKEQLTARGSTVFLKPRSGIRYGGGGRSLLACSSSSSRDRGALTITRTPSSFILKYVLYTSHNLQRILVHTAITCTVRAQSTCGTRSGALLPFRASNHGSTARSPACRCRTDLRPPSFLQVVVGRGRENRGSRERESWRNKPQPCLIRSCAIEAVGNASTRPRQRRHLRRWKRHRARHA